LGLNAPPLYSLSRHPGAILLKSRFNDLMPHKTVTVSAEDVDAMDLDDDEGFMQPPPSTQVFWQSSQTPAWAESTMRKDPRVSSKRERGASVGA